MIAHCGVNRDERPSYKGAMAGDETLPAKAPGCLKPCG